ncbi:MAG: hypothetical protein O8C67_06035, partial [Candidatus Methanoperedens sp.]|nr:hypothetical protein [Candidatus Methanoperedens sp.]
TDYRIEFEWKDADELGPCRAWFCADDSGGVATVALAKHWDNENNIGEYKITNAKLKESAFHEILHLLFSLMLAYASNRWTPRNLLEQEEHKIIRRLENYFYGEKGKKK